MMFESSAAVVDDWSEGCAFKLILQVGLSLEGALFFLKSQKFFLEQVPHRYVLLTEFKKDQVQAEEVFTF